MFGCKSCREPLYSNEIDIEKIVKKLALGYWNTFGRSVMFRSVGYSKHYMDNVIIQYHSASNFSFTNYDYDYIMDLIINKNIRYEPAHGKRERCIYCNKKKCDIRLSCCDQFCHTDCYNCPNYDKHEYCRPLDSTDIIGLNESDTSNGDGNEQLNDTTCMVCIDPCDTITECGHTICRQCVDKLYCNHGDKTKCPMCRQGLVNNKTKSNMFSFDVGDSGRPIKVKVTFQYI